MVTVAIKLKDCFSGQVQKWPLWVSDTVNEIGGLAAYCSQVHKGAKSVEGKVYFIWDAGNWNGSGRWVQRLTFPFCTPPLSTWAPLSPSHTHPALGMATDNQRARAFIDGGRGIHAEKAQSALTTILKLVMQSDKCHLDFFLALPHNLWDLSSLISDWTWGLRRESTAA